MKRKNKKIAFILFLILSLVTLSILTPQKVEGDDTVIEIQDQTESINTPVERDHAVDIAHTIALIETRGTLNCDVPGLSGEKGCHQFMPTTWASYSKDVFGRVVEQTKENATIVTETKVREWIKKGYTDRQIFLIWNQGNPGQCKKGVNKHGVAYNSCAYVDMALAKLKKVMNSLA